MLVYGARGTAVWTIAGSDDPEGFPTTCDEVDHDITADRRDPSPSRQFSGSKTKISMTTPRSGSVALANE
jgi:hypothetical protein